MRIFVFTSVLLLSVLQVHCGTRRQPCKFGDKIEYGHLGKEVKLAGGLDAYVSHPNNTESKGGVIIIQDIYGWQLSNTRAIADMLMENNFTAILPDAYQGRPAWNRSNPRSLFQKFMGERPANGVGPVVDASIEYLSKNLSINKFAIIGFCWGGRAVQHMMSTRKDLVAGVSCYGIMDKDDENFGILNNATLFIYGTADSRIAAQVPGLRRALNKRTKTKFAIRSYKNQPHGFVHRKLASPDDPDKDEIYKARRKMIRWLNQYLTK